MAAKMKHIKLILIVLFILIVAAFVGGMKYPHLLIAGKILLGGFIGGLTNTIAIKMLFEKKVYLPGSGVLYKQRDEIIRSLAKTAEKHLLNTDLMKQRVSEEIRKLDLRRSRRSLNHIVEMFKDDVVGYLGSPAAHRKVKRLLKRMARHSRLGVIPRILLLLGLKDKQFDEVTEDILTELRGQVAVFEITNRMLLDAIRKTGTLEDFIFKPENPMLVKHYGYHGSLADYFFTTLKVREAVINNLSRYSAGDITRIIEENVRGHLSWLEFFGIIVGLFLASIFELLSALMAGGPPFFP